MSNLNETETQALNYYYSEAIPNSDADRELYLLGKQLSMAGHTCVVNSCPVCGFDWDLEPNQDCYCEWYEEDAW